MGGFLIKILRREACRLGREENGVVLMMTVAVFLLLYALCAGVYAVGENVRQKIELQNACDAAAYSAACVQADGLSRIALINRAMSWTYVQLTNLQLDYITWNFLRKVKERFREDRDKCDSWNKPTGFLSKQPCGAMIRRVYRKNGGGWFCGVAGEGVDKVRVNGKVVDISEIEKVVRDTAPTVSAYPETIHMLKQQIAAYNEFLKVVSLQTSLSIKDTAAVVLRQNLPSREDIEYAIDSKPMASPYLPWEEGVDAETAYQTFFHPLFNTESDERIFLSMADNQVYDRLEPYFSNGDSAAFESGGLDQWFVRSTEEESCANASEVKPSESSFAAPGITRVYKNSNRSEFGPIRRGHHVNSSLSFGSIFNLDVDVPPSCLHTRDLYPHQCASVEESTSLYADWDWCSFQVQCFCKLRRLRHREIAIPMPQPMMCSHLCCLFPLRSHKRSSYESCFYNVLKWSNDGAQVAWRRKTRLWHKAFGLTKYLRNPFGHGRLYGDDKSLFDRKTYTGETAKPWILSPDFFSRKGAIVVGVKRTQRNAFASFFGLAGLYSVFNPKADGALVAFSAARAAFRHPANGAGTREYEPRYDAVCHNQGTDSVFKFMGVGCVCGNRDNAERLRRCWNLCTTDWDAMLLPLAYADAAASSADGHSFDSYAGNNPTFWESVDARLSDDDWISPFEMAAALPNWRRFDESSDNPDETGRSGTFLYQRPPIGMRPTGMDADTAPLLNLHTLIKMRIL